MLITILACTLVIEYRCTIAHAGYRIRFVKRGEIASDTWLTLYPRQRKNLVPCPNLHVLSLSTSTQLDGQTDRMLTMEKRDHEGQDWTLSEAEKMKSLTLHTRADSRLMDCQLSFITSYLLLLEYIFLLTSIVSTGTCRPIPTVLYTHSVPELTRYD